MYIYHERSAADDRLKRERKGYLCIHIQVYLYLSIYLSM